MLKGVLFSVACLFSILAVSLLLSGLLEAICGFGHLKVLSFYNGVFKQYAHHTTPYHRHTAPSYVEVLWTLVRCHIDRRHDRKVLELHGANSSVNFQYTGLVEQGTMKVVRLKAANGQEIPLRVERAKVICCSVRRLSSCLIRIKLAPFGCNLRL